MWKSLFIRRKPDSRGHPATGEPVAGAAADAAAGQPAAGAQPEAADGAEVEGPPRQAATAAAADGEAVGSNEKRAAHPTRHTLGPWFRIREALPVWMHWVLGALPILAILGLWWLVTGSGPAEQRIMSPTILPSPLEVAQSFESLWFDRALTRNVTVSLRRVVLGFLVGVAVAFPLGLLMGSFTKIKATFNPIAVLGAYLPIPALVPLTLSLFGTGEKQKVAFLALAFVIYLLPLIVAAVDQVDPVYLKTAYTLGATRAQAVGKVLFAISWPDIYRAMRLGFGVGWSYILLAEMVDIGKGVGGIIIMSQRRGPREHIYLVLLVIILLAFLTDKAWAAGERYLFPYRRAER